MHVRRPAERVADLEGVAAILVLSCAAGVRAESQAPQPQPAPSTAQAYFEFLLARRLEAQGDTAGALAALKRAQTLDPKSAEMHAEIAGFYARQNKATEAVDAAERALTLDANNVEAHRMLGLVFAAWSEGDAAPPPGRTQAQMRTPAIDHLTKILETPLVATDLNLQLTLARLHLRTGHAERAAPILENIVSQAPFATEPYTLLGRSATRARPHRRARSRRSRWRPRSIRATTRSLGDLYERQGRWADAAPAVRTGAAPIATGGRPAICACATSRRS